MILDVARHKLIEAIATLVIIALATVICNIVLPAELVANTSSAPLGALITEFQRSHSILAALVGFALLIRLSMTVTRTTVRSHLYDVNSFGAMSIVPLAIMMLATPHAMLSTIVVATLVAEAMRRLFYAFSSEQRMNAIFTAMLAMGALPLVDCSLLVVVLALPLIVLSLRCSFRDLVIAVVGMLLPIFTYAYVVWCSGGLFGDAVATLWHGMLEPSPLAMQTYLTLPRIVGMAMLLLIGLCSVALYIMRGRSQKPAVRHIWLFMISAVLLLGTTFALLPSTSIPSLVVVAIIVSTMAPMLFLHLSTLLSVVIYLLLAALAVVAM